MCLGLGKGDVQHFYPSFLSYPPKLGVGSGFSMEIQAYRGIDDIHVSLFVLRFYES